MSDQRRDPRRDPRRDGFLIKSNESSEAHVQQIEYLLQQSALGVHFLFDKHTIAKILSQPTDEEAFFTTENMAHVQELLTTFIECPTISKKQDYLSELPRDEYELVVRAYFHLVENSILSSSRHRH
jgi:hypothetical protein